MNFGEALDNLKLGSHLTRTNWNGPGQFVFLQKGYPSGVPLNKNTAEALGVEEGEIALFRPYLMLRTADGSYVPWQPTVSDILADDWKVLLGN